MITAINKVKGFSASALGSLQIDNLPVDKSVTGSPRHNESGSAFKSGVLTENILVTMGVLTGEPYSIAHEGHELVNNLTPHKEAAKEFTGLGSEVELDFHIENAAQAYMPEGDTSPLALILLGVRGEPLGGPQTRISDCRWKNFQKKISSICTAKISLSACLTAGAARLLNHVIILT